MRNMPQFVVQSCKCCSTRTSVVSLEAFTLACFFCLASVLCESHLLIAFSPACLGDLKVASNKYISSMALSCSPNFMKSHMFLHRLHLDPCQHLRVAVQWHTSFTAWRCKEGPFRPDLPAASLRCLVPGPVDLQHKNHVVRRSIIKRFGLTRCFKSQRVQKHLYLGSEARPVPLHFCTKEGENDELVRSRWNCSFGMNRPLHHDIISQVRSSDAYVQLSPSRYWITRKKQQDVNQ